MLAWASLCSTFTGILFPRWWFPHQHVSFFRRHRQCIFQGIPAVNFTGSCKTTAFLFFLSKYMWSIKVTANMSHEQRGTPLVSLPKERRDRDVLETLKISFASSLVTGTPRPHLSSRSILPCLTRHAAIYLFISPLPLRLLAHPRFVCFSK